MKLVQQFQVGDVRFENRRHSYTLGADEVRPRISWKIYSVETGSFQQEGYEIEVFDLIPVSSSEGSKNAGDVYKSREVSKHISSTTQLVPWPFQESLHARQRISIRVKVFSGEIETAWSDHTVYEVGLVSRENWQGERITSSSLVKGTALSQQEHLFRRSFETKSDHSITRARLYIVVQGVYQAEINGQRVGDDVLAPGWTSYEKRIRYQTYDVGDLLRHSNSNCIGIALADGWFCGRLGFFGGRRHRWGPYPAFLAQLEIHYCDQTCQLVCSDPEWLSRPGPAVSAEIYDGEKFDATAAIPGWSEPFPKGAGLSGWEKVVKLSQLPDSVKFTAGFSEPIRPIEILSPVQLIRSPSGRIIIDFGQNFVGYIRLKQVAGKRGDIITLRHAEVLENGELALRPLRICDAKDVFICDGELHASWEPRFTYHGLRYCQVDGWPEEGSLLESIEGIVCHNDFESTADFHCSDAKLNQLFSNAKWSMRGNFFSIPTDCPQRDERLGWTGDIALFAPTALKLYDCFGFLKDWIVDLIHDQERRGGVPTFVTPDIFDDTGIWSEILPVAIWHDVVILLPWALYQSSGDLSLLRDTYASMKKWVEVIPRDEEGRRRLWNRTSFQLGDWLDPTARPEQPMDGKTDPLLVADAFLINSLDLMARMADALEYHEDAQYYASEAIVCRREFHDEYITPNGRLSSDSQTAYALAIVFNLLESEQISYAGKRLAKIIRQNNFKIGTGFAGTPFLCEALFRTGHYQVAYATLLCEECPSWLYPIKNGATTMWERWDSILPNGQVNPGEMTSFNHYCFGSVVSFLCERLAGLQSKEPGWKSIRVAPQPGGGITSAQVQQRTRYGLVSIQWRVQDDQFKMEVEVPALVCAEIIMPCQSEKPKVVYGGRWCFSCQCSELQEWPVDPITAFPKLEKD